MEVRLEETRPRQGREWEAIPVRFFNNPTQKHAFLCLYLQSDNSKLRFSSENAREKTLFRAAKCSKKSTRKTVLETTIEMFCNENSAIKAIVTVSSRENSKGSENTIQVQASEGKSDTLHSDQRSTGRARFAAVYLHGWINVKVKISSSSSFDFKNYRIADVRIEDQDGCSYGKDSVPIDSRKREREVQANDRPKGNIVITFEASIPEDQHHLLVKRCSQGGNPEDRIKFKISTDFTNTLRNDGHIVDVVEVSSLGEGSASSHSEDTIVSNVVEKIWIVCFRFDKAYHDENGLSSADVKKCTDACIIAHQKLFNSQPKNVATKSGSIIVSFKITNDQVLSFIQKRLAFRDFFIKSSRIKNGDGEAYDKGMVPTMSIWNQSTARLQTKGGFPKRVQIQLACPDQKTARSIIRDIKEKEGVWSRFSINAIFIDGERLIIYNPMEVEEEEKVC
eukprot:jgi/Bigna1/82049/fgenesh1_pg.87_\